MGWSLGPRGPSDFGGVTVRVPADNWKQRNSEVFGHIVVESVSFFEQGEGP